jgi:hypothetical protein
MLDLREANPHIVQPPFDPTQARGLSLPKRFCLQTLSIYAMLCVQAVQAPSVPVIRLRLASGPSAPPRTFFPRPSL